MKVPAIIATGLICLALGLGIGVVGMTYLGPIELPTWLGGSTKEPIALEALPPGAGPVMMGKKGKGGGKGGAPKGPTARTQLSSLVAKLDVLTEKPRTIKLDAEQKKQVAENIKGLDKVEELTEEDAKKRLDGLLEVVKDHKEALEAIGFRWPDAPPPLGPPPGTPVPNPFKTEPNGKHLQSLEERVGAATP